MTVDTLYTLVTGAIWRAEQLDELGSEAANRAWREVSELEEEIAKMVPATQTEGRVARRGAVRAALKARDYVRARDLAESYAAEQDVPRALCGELRDMLQADANELSEEFPSAARHYAPSDLQVLAEQLHEHGPFGLVA